MLAGRIAPSKGPRLTESSSSDAARPGIVSAQAGRAVRNGTYRLALTGASVVALLASRAASAASGRVETAYSVALVGGIVIILVATVASVVDISRRRALGRITRRDAVLTHALHAPVILMARVVFHCRRRLLRGRGLFR